MAEYLEEYADWLDHLEKADPVAYTQLMQEIQQDMQAKSSNPTQQPDLDTFYASVASAKDQFDKRHPVSQQSTPLQFPGNKVMEKDGIAAKQQGVRKEMIDVTPGFVLKSKDMNGTKVFVNFCQSEKIKTFSKQKKLDENGEEQEGIHIPLSLGYQHPVKDKAGAECIAFDVAVNPEVIEDCAQDKTGTFKNFLCELALEYIAKKYEVVIEPRYKLPKLKYQGPLPPPQHFIRKDQAPKIEDISDSNPKKTTKPKTTAKPKAPTKRPTESIQYQFYLLHATDTREECDRIPSVEGGEALSPEMLRKLKDCKLQFIAPIKLDKTSVKIQIQVAEEVLNISIPGYYPLELFLPYPVVQKTSRSCYDNQTQEFSITMPINSNLRFDECDPGSSAWLLAQALHDETEAEESTSMKVSKSLPDRFHLSTNSNAKSSGASATDENVQDDEVLPEDRFHQQDIVSTHILQKRQDDRTEKQKKADEARALKRKEYEEKVAKAKEAGKTWREMYPSEPETQFIDVQDLRQTDSSAKTDKSHQEQKHIEASESAKVTAAAWSEEFQSPKQGLQLASSLAFDLLD